MNHSSIDIAGLSGSVAQFKGQALQSMMSSDLPTDLFSMRSHSNDFFDKMLAAAKEAGTATSTTPSGLDASQPFSQPGQNVVTVLNRVEVSFKAQFSELAALKSTLAYEQDAAQKLTAIDAQTSNADIKFALNDFISRYNAGVNRFAPDVAQGGVLEGSQEALRARFATQRDINNPLIGADGGLRGGMSALGIAIDPQTGVATCDANRLDAALAQDKSADVRMIVDFARSFSETIANLNASGNPQDRQLANLDRAIHWIDNNRDAALQEFGAGKAATPNDAFAKAAAAYALLAT